MTLCAGYDVGGAHLKVALVADGVAIRVEQIACPLWRGIDELDGALAKAHALTADATIHAVTMTGELADIFPDRFTGVSRIIERVTVALGPNVRFWIGPRGLGNATHALAHTDDVGSTNFLATAAVCATSAVDHLLIDMGSTTTDIIAVPRLSVETVDPHHSMAGRDPALQGSDCKPLNMQRSDSRPTPVLRPGLTDAARLASGELVYTGLTRTPVMAVTTRGLFRGHWQTLARDSFATMADVRRVLGRLPDGVDQHRTADGRGVSVEESCARLARCFGRDYEPDSLRDWRWAARAIEEAQLASLMEGALQVMAARPSMAAPGVVVAGIGAGVATVIAGRLGLPHVTFGELTAAHADCRAWATACAPAVAVAILAGRG